MAYQSVDHPLRKIGRRTKVNVIPANKVVRKQDDGTDVFGDYWTDSEQSVLSESSTVNVEKPLQSSLLYSSSKAKLGRRTGVRATLGKKIKLLNDGTENFNDYWTENESVGTSVSSLSSVKENDPSSCLHDDASSLPDISLKNKSCNTSMTYENVRTPYADRSRKSKNVYSQSSNKFVQDRETSRAEKRRSSSRKVSQANALNGSVHDNNEQSIEIVQDPDLHSPVNFIAHDKGIDKRRSSPRKVSSYVENSCNDTPAKSLCITSPSVANNSRNINHLIANSTSSRSKLVTSVNNNKLIVHDSSSDEEDDIPLLRSRNETAVKSFNKLVGQDSSLPRTSRNSKFVENSNYPINECSDSDINQRSPISNKTGAVTSSTSKRSVPARPEHKNLDASSAKRRIFESEASVSRVDKFDKNNESQKSLINTTGAKFANISKNLTPKKPKHKKLDSSKSSSKKKILESETDVPEAFSEDELEEIQSNATDKVATSTSKTPKRTKLESSKPSTRKKKILESETDVPETYSENEMDKNKESQKSIVINTTGAKAANTSKNVTSKKTKHKRLNSYAKKKILEPETDVPEASSEDELEQIQNFINTTSKTPKTPKRKILESAKPSSIKKKILESIRNVPENYSEEEFEQIQQSLNINKTGEVAENISNSSPSKRPKRKKLDASSTEKRILETDQGSCSEGEVNENDKSKRSLINSKKADKTSAATTPKKSKNKKMDSSKPTLTGKKSSKTGTGNVVSGKNKKNTHKKIVADTNEEPRRSDRDRIPPLKFWCNERRLFSYPFGTGEIKYLGIHPGTGEDDACQRYLEKREKEKLKNKRAKKTKEDKKDVPATSVFNRRTNEMEEVVLHMPFDCIDWEHPKNAKAASEKAAKIDYYLSKPFISKSNTFGYLNICPNEKKPSQLSPDSNIFFVVLKGHMQVCIGEANLEFRRFDSFIVPKHQAYSIQNLENTYSLLSFTAFKAPFFDYQLEKS